MPIWLVAALLAAAPLAQVAAHGRVQTRADRVTLTVPVYTPGETADAARTAALAKIEALRKALVAAGFAPSAIVAQDPQSPMPPELAGNEFVPSPAVRARPPRFANASVRIVANGAAQAVRAQEILTAQSLSVVGAPELALVDDRAARAAALANAMANARADADVLAAGLNMRVVRIVRVSTAGPGLPFPNFADLAAIFQRERGNATGEVVTEVPIQIDFVFAPR